MAEDDIPPEVLQEYWNRTIVSVSNVRWADLQQTLLDADVVFAELEPLGPIAFTTMADADTPHGQEIWTKAQAGDYGPITPFGLSVAQNVANAPGQLVAGPTLKEIFRGNS